MTDACAKAVESSTLARRRANWRAARPPGAEGSKKGSSNEQATTFDGCRTSGAVIVRRGLMVCDRLPCRLACLPCLVRLHANSFLPFVIPLNMGNLLLSRQPYVFGY